ncbi:hypothetical protein MVI01_48020 [Myxococcus virescens]|uniref:Uncharacterized protein n=1 Tax=Myxococcus virescens TaxID=83456 RepID=A0A511HHG7_9BACT|nr:hypothetical protein MVI01_48020 [Myxococcus virescens]
MSGGGALGTEVGEQELAQHGGLSLQAEESPVQVGPKLASGAPHAYSLQESRLRVGWSTEAPAVGRSLVPWKRAPPGPVRE